ncbi:MAG: hypothetical protein SH820_02305 [Xanthomonadales bacterium]|nr:hypothetical protein [Xanthomonadales bacterium]
MAVMAVLLSFISASVSAFTIDRQLDGYWVEKDLDTRRGWGLQYIPVGPEQGAIFMAGFVYDTATGAPTWVSGSAIVVPGQFEVSIVLNSVKDGVFGPEAGSPVNDNNNWGTMNIEFMDCNNAEFSWTNTPYGSGDNPFEPILQVTKGSENDKCVYQQPFTACPAFSTAAATPRTCVLTGTYTDDITLTNNTIWVLSGGVFIGAKDATNNSNTLTVEAGTRIVGSGGIDLLVVSRGSKIVAEGQPHAPIVFSGPLTVSEGASSGDWGGLVINGYAPINTCTTPPCTAVGEGNSGTYGGDDPSDSSGVLRYVRVQFAGILFTDTDELNGIALQGVGNGTVIDYVQVHRNADDGIEFFGGTVNAKHLILTDIQDDSIDWTQGYSGNIQYAIVKQIQDLAVETDRGMELDNLEQNNDASPRARPHIANVTLLGRTGELGINPRRGTGGNFTNMIVTGFSTCMNIDSAATFTAAGTPAALTGVLTFENTLFNCTTNFAEDAADPWTTASFIAAQAGNETINPGLTGVYPPDGAAYTGGKTIDSEKFGEFFDKVDWAGAVRSADSAWHYNWSIFVD